MKFRSLCTLLLIISFARICNAEASFPVTVEAGEFDRIDTPVRVRVILPQALADATLVSLKDAEGKTYPGQLTPLSLLELPSKQREGTVARELCFIAENIPAGKKWNLTAEVGEKIPASAASFQWEDVEPNKVRQLSYGGRPVLRYMYEPLDVSTKERRMETYKVYHHLFDPAGERLVTKGPGGLFPHHRGLYYGFNRISYGDGKKADVWHCNNGESQAHEETVSETAGPVLGRHVVAISWKGRDGQPFARELRELTVYRTSGGNLIEFASRLESKAGKVILDGDPQHAGFQFRASQEVPEKTKQQTYYLRPDGKDKPGSFRNWPQHKQHVNLSWNALSFVLGDDRYTCCYLDRPENPKEARFSERDYGRFGSYFAYELTEEAPLELNYRIWLQKGEMEVEEAAAKSRNFVSPPVAKAK